MLIRMGNVLDERCRVSEDAHFRLSIPPSENRADYEMTWKNMIWPERTQMTIKYGAWAS
jgi:hypothetical protein